MQVLRHRLTDASGNPVAGHTANVMEYETPEEAFYRGYRRVPVVTAISDDNGWLTWTLPPSKTGQYVVSGIEADQVLITVPDGVSTATVAEIRTGTVSPARPSAGVDLVTELELATRLAGMTSGLAVTPTTDAAKESFVPARLSDPALRAAFGRQLGVYQPSETAALRWRQRRTRVLAGDRQGHIMVLGDSIPFGAAATGASNPKHVKAYPGRIRSILSRRLGPTGGGLTLANHALLSNPAWDPRWAFGGTVTPFAFGPFKQSTFRLAAGGASYVEFTETCSKFVVYLLPSGGGPVTLGVDGVTVGTVGNNAPGTGGSLNRRPGYFANPTIQAHIVVDVPAGTYGQHALRITSGSGGNGGDTYVAMVEAVHETPGTFRVSNMGISGQSLSSFFSGSGMDDATNGLFGLPWIDTARADLLLIALGINDWQGARSVASVKADLATLIARQRATAGGGGAAGAAGDAVLLWNPKPDIAALGKDAALWDAYRAAFYEAADANDACLIDLGGRWKDYATAQAAGLFADTIHPSDGGADDLASATMHALFEVI